MTMFGKLPITGFVSAVFALSFAVSSPALAAPKAKADGDVPVMTLKFFNSDPKNYIFPVLTTGQGPDDIWMQAIFKVPAAQVPNNPYPRTKNFRIYLNVMDSGIPPGGQLTLTLPLYTQLVSNVDPKKPNQYIDWWNGGTIQLYSSETAVPPRALREALNREKQEEVEPIKGAALPKCAGCPSALKFYSDDSDLPKNDPSQLLEFTLGARIELEVKNPNTDPANDLDLKNVDFDVSYVNLAALPAVMGPYQNDQVGYVGTPQRIDTFKAALNQFLKDFPGWPRFVRTYSDNSKEVILKLASPLEIFARLGPDLPPPDLEKPPHWPDRLWAPVEALRTNWIKYAGKIGEDGLCKATAKQDTFCDAIVDAKKLMAANYKNYKAIFDASCKGTPVTLTDDRMMAHVYGWAPFTEAATGAGCPARANLLENTPGYRANDYEQYLRVKHAFDELNYATLTAPKYVFNPWVVLIHGAKYVNAPNVYAYSVDDAVGNIQAEATGIIIDVGSTDNLENKLPAAPPITVNFAMDGPAGVKFTSYRICKNTPDREKPVNPHFQSFVISANDPANCPIYFFDNKTPKQMYTLRVMQKPPFRIFEDQSKARWDPITAKAIACTGNTGNPPFSPSSKTWCCDKTASNGVFAFSAPEPHNAHKTFNHYVITHGPEELRTTNNLACSRGK